jgi:site-specific recombinase XerD
VEEEALDPIRHLVQLRNRIRKKKAESDECMEETCFWMKENGSKMGYDAIRAACTETMAAAGIQDTHGHHLKHAVVTELERAGTRTERIVEYARHKPGSGVWAEHYLDKGNNNETTRKIIKFK